MNIDEITVKDLMGPSVSILIIPFVIEILVLNWNEAFVLAFNSKSF